MQIDTDIFIYKAEWWRKKLRRWVVEYDNEMMTEDNLIRLSKICHKHIHRLQMDWLKGEMANQQGAT